jgi:hypothetical protein
MLETEIRRTKRYQYMMFGGVDLSPPNYYVPAASVPQGVLVPGAAPRWEPTTAPTLATPPQYGSFAGPAPAPQFVVSLMEARPAATATTWVVNSQGIDLRVVAIPVHEILPDEIPRGTTSMVASGFAARENGERYTTQVQTQLKKAYSLSTDGDRVMDFAQAMQVAAPSLPTLSFAAREDSSPWMKFRLNTFGTRMDGLVFSSPLATRADLAAVIVVPGGVNWHFCVLPFHASGHGARRGYSAANIRVSGIDLPEENQANFVTMDTGAIEPGQQCIMFFSFEQDEPVDVWLSMRLFPTRTISPPRSQDAVAKVMGIPLMDGPELPGEPESAFPVLAPDDGAPMIPPPPASPPSPDVTPIYIPESRQ